MTVFLAGGTGVLGQALIPRLIADCQGVRAIVMCATTANLPPEVDVVEGDLLEQDIVRLLDGCDAVVDVTSAILDGSALDPPNSTAHRRIAATQRLLEAALTCRVPCYVQRSIVMVYHDGGDAWLDEHAPLDHSRERAAICGPVVEIEARVRNIDPYVLGWTILRGGLCVGAAEDERALIKTLLAGDAVVAGDGSHYISPINVADMAAAIASALKRAPAGSTFNIVDEPLRYGDYIDALADLVGAPRPQRTPDARRPPSWRCTNDAARIGLQWMPRGRIWPHRLA